MELQFSEDFTKEHGLTPEQVSAVTGFVSSSYIPELKKGWDTTASSQADSILDNVGKSLVEKYGVSIQREKGEKYLDFMSRASEEAFKKQKTELESKISEYEQKSKDFKGADDIKAQLDILKSEKDDLLQKLAELEPLKGMDKKYEEAMNNYVSMEKRVAYSQVRPTFPETVNKYEADAKWNEFIRGVEDKYEIKIVEDKAKAISKENQHIVKDLEQLVSEHEPFVELLKGREQKGTGGKPADSFKEVDGLPFKVKQGATVEEVSQQINEHLSKTMDRMHKDWPVKFKELFNKAMPAATAA